MIPFLDLKRAYQVYGQELEEAVLRVLRSCIYLNGPETRELEYELASFIGVKEAVAVSSGTEALYLILKALSSEERGVVFLPSFTFVATAETVVRAGLIPFFVDVEADYPNLSLESLEKAYELCQKKGYKPFGVIAVSLYGLPARLEEIKKFCEEKNLKLIEDFCQSFGASLNGKKVGSFGEASATSFYPTKTLAGAGDGGMIFTNNSALAKLIRTLKEHGQTRPYYYEYHGVNGRMDELQATILRVKFRYFPEELEKRKSIAHLYKKNLEALSPEVKFFKKIEGAEEALSLFTIRVKKREALEKFLQEEGIGTRVYYPLPLHRQPIYQKNWPLPMELPNTEKLTEEVLSLPFYPYLTEEEVNLVCEKIKNFYQRGH